jgi:tetratricopeptide (TPR) repeat protein
MLGRFRKRSATPDKAAGHAHREAGRAAYERGDYAGSLVHRQRAAEADPRSAWTWLFTAQAHRKLGERDASYPAIRRALEIRPDEPNASWHLIDLLQDDGLRDECRMRVLALCEAHPDEPAILQRGTATLTRLGDRAAALELADRTLGTEPPDGELVAAFAAGLEEGGASEEGEALMASRLTAGTLQATVGRASLLWWRGRPREAWELVRDLPAAQVGPSVLVTLGRSLRGKCELEAARDAYVAAASVDPEHGRAGHWADVIQGECCGCAPRDAGMRQRPASRGSSRSRGASCTS